MKAAHIIILVAIAFCIGFLAARWSQPKLDDNILDETVTTNIDVGSQGLISLEYYLHDSKQPKAYKLLVRGLAEDWAMQNDIDLGMTVRILNSLRDGETNEMLQYFENHLDEAIGSFGSSYSSLPAPLQKDLNLAPLQHARDYRT